MKDSTKKLFKVTLRGMTNTLANTQAHGVSYVIAKDPNEAYSRVKLSLDERNLGFPEDRELDRIELIAEDTMYPDSLYRLHL